MTSFFTIRGSIALGVVGAFLLPAAFMACGGGGSETTASQGGAGSVGSSSTGQGGHGGGSSSSTGQDGGNVAPCPAATICLDVKLLQGQSTAGRLGVVWYQFSDDGPDPVPLVAYDTPFDPGAKRIEIPIASIAIP